jgi:hypothetical protein
MNQQINAGALRPEFTPRIRQEKAVSQTYSAIERVYNPRVYNDGIPNDINKKEAQYMDMAPINSRTDSRNVRQSQPYIPQLNTSTANNPYFQKFDITHDPRNVVREMQGSVYEERTGSRKEGKALMQRNFQHAWINNDDLKRETEERLKGTQVMRPMQSGLISRTSDQTHAFPTANNSVGAGASYW